MKLQCAFALLIILSSIFVGCTNSSLPNATDALPSADINKATIAPQVFDQPQIVRTNIYIFENGYAMYPIIVGKGTITIINSKVLQVVKNYVLDNGSEITDMDFDIMYNDKGIISIVLYAYGEDENFTRYIPLNFDCYTGNQIKLNDLFPENRGEWQQILTENIQGLADGLSLTLLSDIDTVENNRQFYLTKDSLVLVYRLYEITTYSQGMPRFAIPYHKLSGLIEEGSYIASIVEE